MNRFFATLTACAVAALSIIQVYAEESRFSPTAWKQELNEKTDVDGHTKFISRTGEASKFFRDYDLIGMSRTKVISLLGEEDPHALGYLVSAVMDSLVVLQIEYADDKVKGFRMISLHHHGPWHQANMLWTSQTGFTPKEKKSISEQ